MTPAIPIILPAKISSHFTETVPDTVSFFGRPVQRVERSQSPLNGSSFAVICTGHKNSRNALAAKAGLNTFAPAPPKACLTRTDPKSAAIMTAQKDVDAGIIRTRRTPDTSEL